MPTRQIIRIDQEKCDGCGLCVPSCAEGALKIIEGKAVLVTESHCDGLGACLGACPQGALRLEEREAEDFAGPAPGMGGDDAKPGFVCPGSHLRRFAPQGSPEAGASALSHWPIKLRLVSPLAPFLQGAELLVAADCSAFAAGDFHARYLAGRAVVCGCPKFEDLSEQTAKLREILQHNEVTGITVVTMEVPCCQAFIQVVREALQGSGKRLPVTICTLSPTGQVVQQQRVKAR